MPSLLGGRAWPGLVGMLHGRYRDGRERMTPAELLAIAALLHPHAPTTRAEIAFARAAAPVLEKSAPLPGLSERETAALILVVAWEESRFENVIGDHGAAVCPMQIHYVYAPEPRALLVGSLTACVHRGLEFMRSSFGACRGAPLARYCGGCNPAARRKSAERIGRALTISH